MPPNEKPVYMYMKLLRYSCSLCFGPIDFYCPLNKECMEILKTSVEDHGLSARAHDKILRVSRTIADLEGEADIQIHHLTEAINYRQLDRQIWS